MEVSAMLCLAWGSAQLSVARAHLPFAQLCLDHLKISRYCLTQLFTQTTGQQFNGYCGLRCCRSIVGSGRAVLEHGESLK